MTIPATAHPGVRYPPPLLFVGGFLIAAWLNRARPLPLGSDGSGWDAAGFAMMAMGLGLIFWGMSTFARARTAILPNRPATMLVLGGPYRRTRNPMYVGFIVVYVGGTLLLDSIWPLVLIPFLIAILFQTVIRREERYLSAAFGAEYDQYRHAVRRWI